MVAPLWRLKKRSVLTTQACYFLLWVNPEIGTPQNLCNTAIQVRRAGHSGQYWWTKAKLISDVIPWSSLYGHINTGLPAKTNIPQLCADARCCLEDLPGVINDRLMERSSRLCAINKTWWYILFIFLPSIFLYFLDTFFPLF